MGAIADEKIKLEVDCLRAEIERKDSALMYCKNALRNRQGFDMGRLRKTIEEALAPLPEYRGEVKP